MSNLKVYSHIKKILTGKRLTSLQVQAKLSQVHKLYSESTVTRRMREMGCKSYRPASKKHNAMDVFAMNTQEMRKHTPEHWKVVDVPCVMGHMVQIEDAHEKNITFDGRGYFRKCIADRIVACVNACAGLTNNDLSEHYLVNALALQFQNKTQSDEIDALRARVAELENPWQPIETAPKDGTKIIIGMVGSEKAYPVYWDGQYLRWFIDADIVLKLKQGDRYKWMPLPKPPTA